MFPATENSSLYRNRSRTVARSFYQDLRAQGFTHEQIIELSTTLLRMVTEDLSREPVAAAK